MGGRATEPAGTLHRQGMTALPMPARYHTIILPQAASDLTEICTRIEQDSPQNAALVAQRLLDAIDSLELLPHRYKVHEHRTDPTKRVHSMPVSSFIIYYRIDDASTTVRVLHVRHGVRRQPRHFR